MHRVDTGKNEESNCLIRQESAPRKEDILTLKSTFSIKNHWMNEDTVYSIKHGANETD